MAAPYLFRAFGELFPGVTNSTIKTPRSSSNAPATTTKSEAPRQVGRGADNETFVTIDGVLNLFVDEGDCVVQFRPAFEDAPCDTRFGTKILPELSPHWSAVHQHVLSLRDAIATAIRAKSAMSPSYVADDVSMAPPAHGHRETFEQRDPSPQHAAELPPRSAGSGRAAGMNGTRRTNGASGSSARGDLAAITGRIVSWGEEDFPNRRPHGKRFYTSFAVHLQTSLGEQVLQGEGLKDAIAESGCKVGDYVAVRRLRKVKVAAFHESGQPVLKNGQQVYWDKWLWSITLK